MNALRAPLTALAARREQCCLFLLDNADVVIEGMLRQVRTKGPSLASATVPKIWLWAPWYREPKWTCCRWI